MADKSKAMTFLHSTGVSLNGASLIADSVSVKPNYEYYEPTTGMVGSRYPAVTRRVINKKDCRGAIVATPSYAEANAAFLGSFFDGTGTYTPADSPSTNTIAVVVDRGTNVMTYANGWPSVLGIEWSENNPTKWTLDFLGAQETDTGTVSDATPATPVHANHVTCSLGGNTYFITAGKLNFTYNLESRFYGGSQVRQAVGAGFFECSGSITIDLNSDTEADLIALIGTNTGLACVITMTDGVHTITFTIPEFVIQSNPPELSGDGPIQYTADFRAYLKSGETDVVTVTYS